MPKNYEQILDFPGVGHKIALLYFQTCEDKCLGIAVDTHVHRSFPIYF
jgi:endonuclease III